MSENTKFWWLKLHKDFFKRVEIVVVLNLPEGKDFVIFYLKLLCESLDKEGNLRLTDTIPYDEDMLAAITQTTPSIVNRAIKLFTELKMIEILDDKTFYMNELKAMVGSETNKAEKMRVLRAKEKAKKDLEDAERNKALSDGNSCE